MPFDYRTASISDITERANLLPGRLLGELSTTPFKVAKGATTRAEAGLAIEAFFGIPPNARREADFAGAGVELKSLPLKRIGRGLTVKERTVISMIDFNALVEEVWDTAKVRDKLHILFVFFEHLPGRPKDQFPIHHVHLWSPDERTNAFLQDDWERVRGKVRQGKAHELSESDGRIMGPCTKGRNAEHLRSQPFNTIKAKPRAFALKPAFTLELYREVQRSRSARTLLQVSNVSNFESILVQRFSPFVGRNVDEVGEQLGAKKSGAKSYAAAVARLIFGAKSFKTEIKQFAEMGLTPRTTRVNAQLLPYEATSFPAFSYMGLLEESWEDSDLLAQVEYMLFLPIVGKRKETPQGECVFESPRFWRPSAADVELMRREWEVFRLEIRQGRAKNLTPASDTTALHVRPHARNARDTDAAPGIGQVTKKSFWLNKDFVAQILRGAR